MGKCTNVSVLSDSPSCVAALLAELVLLQWTSIDNRLAGSRKSRAKILASIDEQQMGNVDVACYYREEVVPHSCPIPGEEFAVEWLGVASIGTSRWRELVTTLRIRRRQK